jgi:hypothetical protein
MKWIALVLAFLPLILARPAHAETLDFTWQSQAWVRTYESPTQSTVSGPFSLSGRGTVTFAELASGGRTLTFGGSFGGTLIATGDGTFNGPMTFPTSSETRNGLGVLTPTADGFTVVVHRAASGPDAGAAFFGVASPLSSSGHPSATASEPGLVLAVAAGLIAAARLRPWKRRRRVAS